MESDWYYKTFKVKTWQYILMRRSALLPSLETTVVCWYAMCRPHPVSYDFCISIKKSLVVQALIHQIRSEANHSGPHTVPQAYIFTFTPPLKCIDNQVWVQINMDTHLCSKEAIHLNYQDCEFPSRARTLLAGGGAEEEQQTSSGPISSLL